MSANWWYIVLVIVTLTYIIMLKRRGEVNAKPTAARNRITDNKNPIDRESNQTLDDEIAIDIPPSTYEHPWLFSHPSFPYKQIIISFSRHEKMTPVQMVDYLFALYKQEAFEPSIGADAIPLDIKKRINFVINYGVNWNFSIEDINIVKEGLGNTIVDLAYKNKKAIESRLKNEILLNLQSIPETEPNLPKLPSSIDNLGDDQLFDISVKYLFSLYKLHPILVFGNDRDRKTPCCIKRLLLLLSNNYQIDEKMASDIIKSAIETNPRDDLYSFEEINTKLSTNILTLLARRKSYKYEFWSDAWNEYDSVTWNLTKQADRAKKILKQRLGGDAEKVISKPMKDKWVWAY